MGAVPNHLTIGTAPVTVLVRTAADWQGNVVTTDQTVGGLLRSWRQRRRVSQLELALDSDVSTRHISFLETGRSLPSRQMILHLAEHLDIPLRERNELMTAAGYAPVYSATALDDPSMDVVRSAIELVLTGHEPYPALAIDRYWTLVAANRALGPLLEGVSPALLEPPVNVLRLSLHPEGLAPRIINLDQWRDHVFKRLRHYIEISGDPKLIAVYEELQSYQRDNGLANSADTRASDQAVHDLVMPLRVRMPGGELSFFTTTTVFGTANDVTLSELAIESLYPADAATAEILRGLMDGIHDESE